VVATLASRPKTTTQNADPGQPKVHEGVYTNEKRVELANASDSEGVTMRSGRRVNDDTMGNLIPTTTRCDVFPGGLSATRAREGRPIAWPFTSGLAGRSFESI
jgi:hypothetical protein